MGDNYISFYGGGYSSMNPNVGNYVGFRMGAGQLASTTSPMTANQLNEAISRIKEGVKNVEVSLVSPEIADGVPRQQFEEMKALMKLTGVKPSVHAPVIDPSGFGERGYGGDYARADVERRFIDVLEKAHALDADGNIPVVFHASNAGTGSEYRPQGKEGNKDRFHIVQEAIINRETGQLQAIKEDRKFYSDARPTKDGKGKILLDASKPLDQQGEIYSIERSLRSANVSDWDNSLREIFMLKKEAEENIDKATNKGRLYEMMKGLPIAQKEGELTQNYLNRAEVFMEDTNSRFASVFSKAYEYGSKEQRKILEKTAKEWNKELEEKAKGIKDQIGLNILNNELMDKKLRDLNNIMSDPNLGGAPKINVRAEDFAREKAAETFGNVAWKSFEKWKDKAPVMAIENLYPGMAFSRAEDLKKLIEESKAKFIENAKGKMSESEAKKKADKLIGATWDVGHLNIHKKHGFTDKDLVEETKKITPLVKHVHLTDNFGYGDSHLGIGMGNVPVKELLKELEKNGDFASMRKVIEAGGLVDPNKGLKMNPLRATMGAFGSQVGGGSSPAYWNQIDTIQGNYFGFPMAYLPEKHFSMYGSGFSTLPEELGGQVPGTGSRFSGTPNA